LPTLTQWIDTCCSYPRGQYNNNDNHGDVNFDINNDKIFDYYPIKTPMSVMDLVKIALVSGKSVNNDENNKPTSLLNNKILSTLLSLLTGLILDNSDKDDDNKKLESILGKKTTITYIHISL
jgi:hypothetical protein